MNEAATVDAPIVIGTGHAGMAAVNKLVQLGYRPVVVDAGLVLDREREAAVRRLAAETPSSWPESDTRLVSENPTVHDPMPRRLSFGSRYVYADEHPASPVKRSADSAPVPTLARGGFSRVWGAAMLPAADCDLGDWPFGHADLAPHYREVLASIPFSAREDRLAEQFPVLRADPHPLTLPPQADSLLRRLERNRRLAGRDDVSFGQARLAVDAGEPSRGGCVYCGHCLSGCVYGSIYGTEHDLDRLLAEGSITYRDGHVVRRIEETDRGVRVDCDLLSGGQATVEGPVVFLAAGAINTTRIVLESRRMWGQPVRLASTGSFLLPLIQGSLVGEWPARNTLASIFFELKVPGSPHWVHAQIGTPNELVRMRLGLADPATGRRHQSRAWALAQTLTALCNVHSDEAGHHLLTVHDAGDRPPVMEIRPVSAPGFRRYAARAGRRLSRHLFGSGAVGTVPLFESSEGPASWHFGGTFPMSRRPEGRFETDALGRLAPWKRVHLVDSSVFSSIPATTVALLTMANSTRITAQAMAAATDWPNA